MKKRDQEKSHGGLTIFHLTLKKLNKVSALRKVQQAGTGPSRRHIQGSKIAKRLPSVKYSFTLLENRKFFEKNSKKLHTQKNGPSGESGPASASPWRAKRGTLPKLSTFLSQLKGEPFGEKTNFRISPTMPKNWKGDPLERKKFRKKSHNAEKLKGGTLWGFSTSILSQNIKKLKGGKFLFSEISQCRKKTERWDPLGFSNIHSVAKQQKN